MQARNAASLALNCSIGAAFKAFSAVGMSARSDAPRVSLTALAASGPLAGTVVDAPLAAQASRTGKAVAAASRVRFMARLLGAGGALESLGRDRQRPVLYAIDLRPQPAADRSEEHTSELQSQSNLV